MKSNILNIAGTLSKKAKTVESYNTGLAGEHLIVACYDELSVDHLEKMQYIIGRIIKKKKEYKRAQDAQIPQEMPKPQTK